MTRPGAPRGRPAPRPIPRFPGGEAMAAKAAEYERWLEERLAPDLAAAKARRAELQADAEGYRALRRNLEMVEEVRSPPPPHPRTRSGAPRTTPGTAPSP